jgi:hypothetical protein
LHLNSRPGRLTADLTLGDVVNWMVEIGALARGAISDAPKLRGAALNATFDEANYSTSAWWQYWPTIARYAEYTIGTWIRHNGPTAM